MTPRGLRNRAFEAVTPNFVSKHFPQHGRVIGNALSYSREIMSPFLLATAALGIKGRGPGSLRFVKMLLDGYDGFAAERDREFKTAMPTLAGLKELRKAIWIEGKPIIASLRETAGGPLDHEADQNAQIADQTGNVLQGDLDLGYLFINGTRNRTIRRMRGFYKSLGVKSASHSRPAGQFKTLVMDGHQTLESYGWLNMMPGMRKPLSALGKAAITYSFVDSVSAMERSYLEPDYDVSGLSTIDGFMLGCARYATRNMPNIEVFPAHISRLGAPTVEHVA